MKINGLMIDCVRLLEPETYYYRLLDFMADWGMNTLLLHFSDDHGVSLKLRGFGDLALPHAFTPDDLEKFLEHARTRSIEVIPELETFGHARYITDKPKYRHLFAGRWTRKVGFSAIDPLHPDTHSLMGRLIRAVAKVFPSEYLHLGCDEVNLAEYCRRRRLPDADVVWVDYVNRMIDLARKAGKIPMLWADHVAKSDRVAEGLRKDVVLVEWRYWQSRKDVVLPRLKRFGFESIIVAPSIACYRYRFLPPRQGFENTNEMLAIGKKHKVMGLINTVWCPWRYLQNTMYYGIAYSATAVRKGSPPNIDAFNRTFARKLFGTGLTASLKEFLAAWTELAIHPKLVARVLEKQPVLSPAEIRQLRKVRQLGARAMVSAEKYTPESHPEIWHAMVLSARCVWLCAESLLLRQSSTAAGKRITIFNQSLDEVRREMAAEWDRTRYPDAPEKTRPRFPNEQHEHAMMLIGKLPFARTRGIRN